MYFEVFYEVFLMDFVCLSIGFIGFEVFCPVWALYNIKREWDTPQRPPLPGAARQKAGSVPWTRLTLYRVPVCQRGTLLQNGAPTDACLAHLFVSHCCVRTSQTCNVVVDRFLAHLFVSHCPFQAQTKCSGKPSGSRSIQRPVAIQYPRTAHKTEVANRM